MKISDSQSQRLERQGVRKYHLGAALATILTMIIIVGVVGAAMRSASEVRKSYSWQKYNQETDMISLEIKQVPI